jgi:hypothetical protein
MPEKIVGEMSPASQEKKNAHMTEKLVELDERLLLFFSFYNLNLINDCKK